MSCRLYFTVKLFCGERGGRLADCSVLKFFFREGSSNLSTPPLPSPSPHYSEGEVPGQGAPLVPKQEQGMAPAHPMAAEAMAAQASFEAQMKTLYNNPFASQLLAASSKMFTTFDVNPFLQPSVKQVV